MGCEDLYVMGGWQAAQAVEFIRTLRIQLREMTGQLAFIERQHVTRRNARACAMRVEAAALRRDIAEARVLIDRLQRRYLTGDERTPTYGLASRRGGVT